MWILDTQDSIIRGIQYYNPAVHAFYILSQQMGSKQWEIEERDFPQGGFLPSGQRQFTCSLQRLLLATGIAMTNATTGNAIEAWHAIIKHSSLFSSSDLLKVNEFINEIDSHKKSIYADEIGVGAGICVSGDLYDVRFFADAGYFINRTISDRSSPYHNMSLRSLGIYGRTGKVKPDYFCLSTTGEAVVVETKGTFGPYGNLTGPIQEGKEQVRNVKPDGVPIRDKGAELVVGIQVPIENINRRSTPHTIVADPEFRDPISINLNEEEIIRFSIAKTLGFAGYPNIATSFIDNPGVFPWEEFLQKYTVSVEDQQYVIAQELMNGWMLGYSKKMVEALVISAKKNLPILKAMQQTEWIYQKEDKDTRRVKMLSMGFGLFKI